MRLPLACALLAMPEPMLLSPSSRDLLHFIFVRRGSKRTFVGLRSEN